MNDFIVGDTITCKDAQEAAEYAAAVGKAGYIWDCEQDFKTGEYIITILGRRAADDHQEGEL